MSQKFGFRTARLQTSSSATRRAVKKVRGLVTSFKASNLVTKPLGFDCRSYEGANNDDKFLFQGDPGSQGSRGPPGPSGGPGPSGITLIGVSIGSL